jgi:hypothetical protein
MSLVDWLRWQNIVDFVVLTIAFYVVPLPARQTCALRFALTIVVSTPWRFLPASIRPLPPARLTFLKETISIGHGCAGRRPDDAALS